MYRRIFGFNRWNSVKSFIHGLGFLDLKHIFMLRKAKFFWKLRSTDSLLLSNLYHLFMYVDRNDIWFSSLDKNLFVLGYLTFMKSKRLLQIDFPAFVVSIMTVKLLLFYLFCFVLTVFFLFCFLPMWRIKIYINDQRTGGHVPQLFDVQYWSPNFHPPTSPWRMVVLSTFMWWLRHSIYRLLGWDVNNIIVIHGC